MRHLSIRFQIAAACCLFILGGLAIIPYPGIQNDEALFASPLYQQNSKEFCFSAFHRQVPLMIMSYVGTLKTLLYMPILRVFGANLWSVRLPMLLVGVLTIFFFYRLAYISAGSFAALTAAFFLATDPSFLLTDTFDWGPVALGRFLLVTGCFMLVRFAQSKNHRMLGLSLGFFFLGLGLWNKALFFWMLAGLGCGAVAVFGREIRRLARPRSVIVAILAFLFGASPFVMYNIRHPNATLSGSAHFNSAAIAMRKIPALRATLDGSGLFGFFTEHDSEPNPRPPHSLRGRAASLIRDRLGEHRRTGMAYAFGLSLLAVPWWWKSRTARFSLVFLATAWSLMALTRDAGSSIHHTVLLWPFPQLFVAATLAALPWRGWAAGIAVALVALNLLVVNQYIADFERNGAAGHFTDAVMALSDAIPESGEPVYVVDWGMLNTLSLLHQGRLELRASDPPFLANPPSVDDTRYIDYVLNDSSGIFVGHVPGREAMAGVQHGVDTAIASRGLRKRVLRVIDDSNGRPVFEIFLVER